MESVDECPPNPPFHTSQAKRTQLDGCTGATVSGRNYAWAKRRHQTRPMGSLPPRDQSKKCHRLTKWRTRTCCMIPTLLVLVAATLVIGYFVCQLQFPESLSCDVGRTCARVKVQDSENRNCRIDIAYDCRLQLNDSFGLATTAILVNNNTLKVTKAGQYLIQSFVFVEGYPQNGSCDSQKSPMNIYIAREPLTTQTTKVLSMNFTVHTNFSHIYGLHNFNTMDYVFVMFYNQTVNNPASFIELILIQE